MKIRFVEPSPKAGTVEHVAASVAHNLIAAGFAELCPLPARGTAGWLEQRNEQAKLAAPVGSTKGDNSVAVPFTENVEWGVRDKLAPTGTVAIIRRHQYETVMFDQHCIQTNGFPADCPQSIIKQYNTLTQQAGVDAEALEEARRKQNAHNEATKFARRW